MAFKRSRVRLPSAPLCHFASLTTDLTVGVLSVFSSSGHSETTLARLFLLRLRFRARQAQYEGGAALAGTDCDRPAVRLRELARDREAEAGSLLLGGEERCEYPRARRLGNARTAVGNRDRGRAVGERAGHQDFRVAGRGLDRVPEHVHDRLLDLELVEPSGRLLRTLELDRHSALGRLHPAFLDRLGE